ncbi:MAG TPA: DUF5020 family protein [Bacteroidaceae bacterium]|nr:DUF5020 family protein [Bacteroidaceae bacterium]
MKKILLSVLFGLGLTLGAFAQTNVQFHYDFGRTLYSSDQASRPHITTTLEHLSSDKWGSTFFFVDVCSNSTGVQSAYTEITRDFKLGDSPITAHVEYNGGLWSDNDAGVGYQYDNSYLLGVKYTLHSADFSRGISFIPMYKYIQKNSSPNNFQFTTVWWLNFCNGGYTFSGFADIWREDSRGDGYGSLCKFITEPQFWFNLNKLIDGFEMPISVGSEIEISQGFVNMTFEDKFYINPTLAVKWTF